jgi:hypothetical protein
MQKSRSLVDAVGWHVCLQGSEWFCFIDKMFNRCTHLGACCDFQVLDLVFKGFQNGLSGLVSADEIPDAFALSWVFDLKKAI